MGIIHNFPNLRCSGHGLHILVIVNDLMSQTKFI